jgi:hypothetical protein
MSASNSGDSGPVQPDARLSRRSLIAAAGILATAGSTAASKAFAFSSPSTPRFSPRDGSRGPQGEFGGNGGGGNVGGGGTHNCFLAGTRILTPIGEIAIEALKIGDLVETLSGEAVVIRWIGRVEVCREPSQPWDREAQTVRIAKDALAEGCPHRDLHVSRAHLLFLNGVLVPAEDLINGSTICAVDPGAEVAIYFHIELDRHDVLLADGAPCESLLASVEARRNFDNFAEFLARYGAGATPPMTPFAPVVGFNGGRSQLRSRLRSAFAPIIDVRQPLDIVRDTLEARALFSKAA